MNVKLCPFQFNQNVKILASKSYLQRYIALASISEKESVISNINLCDDVMAALQCAKAMGAEVLVTKDEIKIKGIKREKKYTKITLDVNESGLSARMFSIIASALFNELKISGSGSILNRSMQSLINILEKGGCKVISDNGHLPLHIKGSADFSNTEIDNTDTSQIITGLLYAALVSANNVHIRVKNPVSVPYIRLSIECARLFGADIRHNEYFTEFYISKHTQFNAVRAEAEGDWSNAAFFAVAAALSGECNLYGLNKNSLQGDKMILEIIQQAGAEVFWENDICNIRKKDLKPFEADLYDYPDLFPPLCVLGLGIKGESKLYGIQRLINKESNRAEVLVNEFSKTGAEIKINNDVMLIKGKGYLEGGEINSNNDHRIAMAGAIAACISKKDIVINHAEAVNKSYPFFFENINTVECI